MDFDVTQLAGGFENEAQPTQLGMMAQYKQLERPNLTQRLEAQIAEMEHRLARHKEALAELKKNPGIEHLLNILQRV